LKVIIDMNLSVRWENFLKERGFDCQHWWKIGAGSDSDNVIAKYCRASGAVVLTADLDFAEQHAFHGTRKPSVIQLRASDLLLTALGQLVARAFTVANESLNRGAIVTITPGKTRVAKLPIGNTEPY
jgi:predicted nuclease of predicted toxin-antitoxin system